MATQVMARAKDAIRTFNKYVLNPVMLLLAGRKWWYAGVIRHTGRRTGRKYATPVVVNPVADDGFVIPLAYGTGADWLRNVLATGRATVVFNGVSCEVGGPEIIDTTAAAALLPARRIREFKRFGIRHFVKLQRVQNQNPMTTRR